ncbi:MAG: CxxC-x17-CxxC domain-containing protein [Candidatus Paceibacterota bacterium]|jgi:CxxC-x17-CxxC domain-containing protein
MGDFRHDEGRRFGDQRGGFGGRDRRPVTMHQAICAECGKPCEVPFRPTDGKPVYCSVCFGAKKNAGTERGGDRYQKDNFRNPANAGSVSNAGKSAIDDVKKQLVILNVKMDRLIKAAEAISGTKPVPAVAKDQKPVKTMPVAKDKKPVKKAAKKKKK